jgi:hypothetical protein
MLFYGGLIAMKERVYEYWLVVSQPIHKAKAIERALQLLSLPQFGE